MLKLPKLHRLASLNVELGGSQLTIETPSGQVTLSYDLVADKFYVDGLASSIEWAEANCGNYANCIETSDTSAGQDEGVGQLAIREVRRA